ncbi:MAG: RNA polymerase sigma factor, partial [Bacteroidota bacterium]|nr:RNA polymerase sigma factor [Bacteroidota bacterium]
METITKLIKGCINNDHKCHKALYEQYRGFALKIAFRYIYRYEKAVDVVTDSFIKVFTHFSTFEEIDGIDTEKIFMGWLKRIIINTAIDELRRGNLLPQIGGIPDYVWDITDKNNDADQVAMYNDLIALIKELPPAYGTVFNLYVIDGYTHSEIADKLNISIGTSKS